MGLRFRGGFLGNVLFTCTRWVIFGIMRLRGAGGVGAGVELGLRAGLGLWFTIPWMAGRGMRMGVG